MGKIFNAVAAFLATISAGSCAAAAYLSENTLVNQLSFFGCCVGVLAGIVWLVAALLG